MAVIEYRHEAALIRFGARAEGKINSFRSITAARGTKVYYFNVTWRNELDGKLYQKELFHSRRVWARWTAPADVTVTYDPKRPGDSWVGIRSRPDIEHIVIASIITILGIAGLTVMHFLASIILRVWRIRRSAVLPECPRPPPGAWPHSRAAWTFREACRYPRSST